MTAVRGLLTSSAFRAALDELLALPQQAVLQFREELGAVRVASGSGPIPAPNSSADAARRAYRTLYDLAQTDGVEEVVSDLRQNDTVTESWARIFREALAPNALANERVDGTGQRDALLPVLRQGVVAIDLRFVDLESGRKLVPVVTTRLEFDADVNGSTGAVFQIPVRALPALREQIQEAEEAIRELGASVGPYEIPTWSTLDQLED